MPLAGRRLCQGASAEDNRLLALSLPGLGEHLGQDETGQAENKEAPGALTCLVRALQSDPFEGKKKQGEQERVKASWLDI